MSEAAELLAATDAIAGVFRRFGISFFVTGSFASGLHGEFRATNDIDLVADIRPTDLGSLIDALSAEFVADEDQARAALATSTSFNLIHRATYLKVDVFSPGSDFDRTAMTRAEMIVIPGAIEPLPVATTEDILLAKLRWYRLGGEESEVQRRDIRGLIALNGESLDGAYLERWARALDVADLLVRFWSSAS